MKITAHFFASAREAVGVRQLQLDLTDGATAADLVQQLVSDYPRLAGCTAALRVAVNEAYTDLDTVLHQNDEVALIPPVSGGSPHAVHRYRRVPGAPQAGSLARKPG